MFSYGYPRHCSPFGGYFGPQQPRHQRSSYGGAGYPFGPSDEDDERAYAYEQYRRRQAQEQEIRRQRQAQREEQEKQAYLREVARRRAEQEAYEVSLYPARDSHVAEPDATDSQNALQAEHARRQQARRQRADDPLVRVVLPDGRRATVPLSWVDKIRAKHGQTVAREAERSPSPPAEHDEALAPTLEAQDDVTVDSASDTESESEAPKTTALTPEFAATILQRVVRRFLHLKKLRSIQSSFDALRDEFAASPAAENPSTLVFASRATSTSTENEVPRLAYNTPANRPLQSYEEALTRLLIQLDGVESGGDREVKKRRKGLVLDVERALEGLENLKKQGWTVQVAAAKEPATEDTETMQTEEAEPAGDAMEVDRADADTVSVTEAPFLDAPDVVSVTTPDFGDLPDNSSGAGTPAAQSPHAKPSQLDESAPRGRDSEDGTWDMVDAAEGQGVGPERQ